jgi:hypothetical protein
MSPSNRSHFTIVSRLVALVALLAAVTAVLTFMGNDPAHSATEGAPANDPSVSAQPTAAEVAEREALFVENFARLSGPVADDIPATANVVDEAIDLGSSRRLEPVAARRLAGEDAAAPEAAVWVAPREDGTQCLVALMSEEGGGYGCATPQQAVGGSLMMTLSRDDSHAEIYGLLPDGVDSVTVTLADGTASTLPVVDNTFMARYDQMTSSIAWLDADGVEQTHIATSGG